MQNTVKSLLIITFIIAILVISGCSSKNEVILPVATEQAKVEMIDIARNVCSGIPEKKSKEFDRNNKAIHKTTFLFFSNGTEVPADKYDSAHNYSNQKWIAENLEDLELVVCVELDLSERTGENCGSYKIENSSKYITGIAVRHYAVARIVEAKTGNLVKEVKVTRPNESCPYSLIGLEDDFDKDEKEVSVGVAQPQDIYRTISSVIAP